MVLLVRDDDRAGLMPTVQLSGVLAVKLFASGSVRDTLGLAGAAPGSLMARAIEEVKGAEPELTVMTETCLCSYTPAGE